MTRYQVVTLGFAIGVAASLIGVGISIGERSTAGIVLSLLAATLLMGGGFRYKKKHQR
ncbi:YlaF family protein [Brevibacillus humidisoli]|uniref:DUF5325 family protein n=1 Tax=Brevibacillus humidisoli TaxID=2895522 RepID=UPI001E3F8CDC|nr:DUF5325 family protein [Brevibacillus humidisoli]UFJ41215.1 YlaF family protein [Brevibacillus humidisoli]